MLASYIKKGNFLHYQQFFHYWLQQGQGLSTWKTSLNCNILPTFQLLNLRMMNLWIFSFLNIWFYFVTKQTFPTQDHIEKTQKLPNNRNQLNWMINQTLRSILLPVIFIKSIELYICCLNFLHAEILKYCLQVFWMYKKLYFCTC